MSIYQTYTPEGTDGLFLKLKDGDKVKMRIVSEPAITVFKAGDRPRYNWVVFNRDREKAQIYAAGVSVYSQIADLVEEWGEPTEFDITVKRTGSGMNDTEYSVVPSPKSKELTEAQLDEANKIDLIQATRGKLLSDYAEDGILPDPIMSGTLQSDPAPTDDDAPQDMPEDFLTK